MPFKLEGAQDATQASKPFKLEGAQDASAPKEEMGFTKRVGEDFSKRSSGDIGKKLASGDISAPSAALQTLEAGGGFVGDVGAEAIKSGLNYVPESIKQPIANKATQAAKYVAGTDIGKAGIEKATQVKQTWDAFAKKHPEAAADIGGLPNLLNLIPASSLAGATGSAALSAGEKAAPSLAKIGAAATKSGAKDIAEAKAKRFMDLAAPKMTKFLEKENVDKIEQEGLLRRNTPIPSPKEEAVADTLSKVPGINLGRSNQYNYNAVKKAVTDKSENLASALRTSNVVVPKESINQALMSARDSLADKNYMVGSSGKYANAMLKEAEKLASKNGNTAAGLLQTRQEFDKYAKSQIKGNPTLDRNLARKDAWYAVRDSLNNLTVDSVPDVRVKQSLTELHHLLIAKSNLQDKAIGEGSTAISRGINKLENIVPVHPLVKHAIGLPLGLAASAPYYAGKGIQSAAPYAKLGIGKGLTAMSDILGPSKKSLPKLLSAPEAVTVVNRQGVARPITGAERQAGEAARTKALETGLTPDVRATQIRNEVNKAYEQRNLARNALKEEQIAKIAEQSAVPIPQLIEMSDRNIKELSDILGNKHSDTAFAQALRKAMRDKGQ
jgi:hypothetical protein